MEHNREKDAIDQIRTIVKRLEATAPDVRKDHERLNELQGQKVRVRFNLLYGNTHEGIVGKFNFAAGHISISGEDGVRFMSFSPYRWNAPLVVNGYVYRMEFDPQDPSGDKCWIEFIAPVV